MSRATEHTAYDEGTEDTAARRDRTDRSARRAPACRPARAGRLRRRLLAPAAGTVVAATAGVLALAALSPAPAGARGHDGVAGTNPAAPSPGPAGPSTAASTPTPEAAALEVVLLSGPAHPTTPAEVAAVHRVGGVEVAAGRSGLERPDGACSSPVPLPESFESACRTHDLGYQMLRVADERGRRLPPDRRRAVDSRLAADLEARCSDDPDPSDRLGCRATAHIVAAVVRANSLRQSDGPPVHEDWGVDL